MQGNEDNELRMAEQASIWTAIQEAERRAQERKTIDALWARRVEHRLAKEVAEKANNKMFGLAASDDECDDELYDSSVCGDGGFKGAHGAHKEGDKNGDNDEVNGKLPDAGVGESAISLMEKRRASFSLSDGELVGVISVAVSSTSVQTKAGSYPCSMCGHGCSDPDDLNERYPELLKQDEN